MSYIGVNPNRNIRRFTEVKPDSSYPLSALKEIKLLTFGRDKTAQPFGSYIYRIQKYPGDLDLVEEFTECCSLDDVVTQFAKALQNVVRKINKERLHYFSEVKAGLDERYDVNIGEMLDGTYFPNLELKEFSQRLFKKKLLSKEENDIIQYILSSEEVLGEDEYDTIHYIFRNHRIIRWSDEEILKGFKILPGNKKITLKYALSQSGKNDEENHIKIDMISELGGRLVEITNFFQLAYEDEGEMHLVNIDLEKNHDIPTQLPKEIEKLYFSNMYYSPFKMIKRMYSLGRHNLDQNLLSKVIPFVSSNTSLLYQIKSEIDTIILVIERIKSYPKKSIARQLDDMKLRLSTVLELSQDDLIQMNNMIDKINFITSKYEKVDLLKDLKKLIVAHVNMQTINYLQKVGLNPPPYQYLPPKHTYDVNHIRGPGENPVDPYKKYLAIIDTQMKGKGGYNVYYPASDHHFPNFFEDPNSSFILSNRIRSNPGLHEIPKTELTVELNPLLQQEPLLTKHSQIKLDKAKEFIEKQLEEQMLGEGSTIGAWWSAFIRRYRNENKEDELDNIYEEEKEPPIFEGKGGNGAQYAHNYVMPLYMNENLKIPKLQQNEMHLHPQTASSYASDYTNRGYGPSLKGVHINNAPWVLNGQIMSGIHASGCDNCGLKNFRKKKQGLEFEGAGPYQKVANVYRKLACKGKARPLLDGEYHYGCHNYTGPGTRIDMYPNYPPYNNIDACSRQHDLDYSNAQGNPQLIRQADEKVIQCYNKYPNENGYNIAKLGINSKMALENALPLLVKSVAPSYFGKK